MRRYACWLALAMMLGLGQLPAGAAITGPPASLSRLIASAEDIVLLKRDDKGAWVVDRVLIGSEFHAGDAFPLEISQYQYRAATGPAPGGGTELRPVNSVACIAFTRHMLYDGRRAVRVARCPLDSRRPYE